MLSVLMVGCGVALATTPPGYYDGAEGKAGQELREALHTVIRNHHVVPYFSGSQADTSDALRVLDRSPVNTNEVVEIYSGSNALASSFGLTTGWNREHLWCNSYGLDDVEPAFSDLHNLRACDANVNSSRGNKYYDTTATNTAGYAFPAHLEEPWCSTDSDSWELTSMRATLSCAHGHLMRCIALLLALALPLGAGATPASQDRLAGLARQVPDRERAFAKTMADRDHQAFASFVADEALFLSETRTLRGRRQVADGWKPFFGGPQAPFAWEPERVEVLDSGTLALSSGPVRDPQGKRIGTFNSIWRLEFDGAWRVIFDKGCPPCGQ